MGLFSGLGSFFGPVGSILGGIGDDILGRDDAQEANSTAYAQQRQLRQTAYQDTTQDLQKAGLNPMLAYSNGATSAAAGPPVLNKGLASTQQNSAGAAVENTRADTVNKQAQTEQINAQTRLINAQTQNTTTSTGKIDQETKNLQQDISRILAQTENLHSDSRLKTDQAELARYQSALAKTQNSLTAGTINYQEAQKQLVQIQTRLAKLTEQAGINSAEWEKDIGEAGKAGTAAGSIIRGLNSTRQFLGIGKDSK